MSQPFGGLLQPGEALIWQARPMALDGATALRLGQVCFGLLALGWGGWRRGSMSALWQKKCGGIMKLLPFRSAKTVLFPAEAILKGRSGGGADGQ